MPPATRAALRRFTDDQGRPRPYQVTNASLLLSRYLPVTVGGDNATIKHFLDRVCIAHATPLYRAAYDRWMATLAEMGETVAQRTFAVRTRMIVGLGAESVRETAVTLQRASGLPYIPGSALKGLARHYAERTRDAQGGALLTEEERDVLFGEPGNAAYVTYFDAWYVPDSAEPDDRPLRRDVMTVHHPNYYRSQGTGPGEHGPWDFDDPTPLNFLSATGQYLIAVRCADGAWADLALEVLTHALADWGIGAKTASGYGRLTPARVPNGGTRPNGPSAPPDEAAVPSDPLVAQIRALPRARVRPEINKYYLQAKALPDPAVRAVVAAAICDRLKEVGALPDWASRPWVQEVLSWRDATGDRA